jgi:hypothetical protein
MTATRRPTPTAARPATLTPREQAAILDRANALFIVAVSGRNKRPDVTAQLRHLAVGEMAIVVRSRLLIEEFCER